MTARQDIRRVCEVLKRCVHPVTCSWRSWKWLNRRRFYHRLGLRRLSPCGIGFKIFRCSADGSTQSVGFADRKCCNPARLDVLGPLKDVLLTELASGPNDRDGLPAAAHKERGPLAPSASVSRFSSNVSSFTCSLNVFKVTPASQTRSGLTIGIPGAGSLILRRAQVGADGAVWSWADVWGWQQNEELARMVSIDVLHRPPWRD